MKNQEEKINQFIENQQKALADLKAELLKELNPKVEFEVGKYYNIVQNGEHCNGFNLFDYGAEYVLRFKEYRETSSGPRVIFLKLDGLTEVMFAYKYKKWLKGLSTESEVKEALIKEAEKRGFKPYVKVNATNITDRVPNSYTLNADSFSMTNDYGSDTLRLGGSPIYAKGVWATIVKDEAIKIGTTPVEFNTAGVKIGCKRITKEDIESIYDFMIKHNFSNISLDGHSTNLSTINAILEKLK